MPDPRTFSLEAIRTDGWFERIGESIGSFQALCDIVGPRFFAFAMITGARITTLTVDRRTPDNTQVDFVVAQDDEEVDQSEAKRLTLVQFRERLVAALSHEEPTGPVPERTTDIEALQLYIGIRYLLLAPLFGYSLLELTVEDDGEATVRLMLDGVEERLPLNVLRGSLRAHVRQELERARRGGNRGAIDLSRIPEAEAAARRGQHIRVLELLGSWPAPLAIFLRTPEGQGLAQQARTNIARALVLLGTSCIELSEREKGEEVLRLSVQYAGDGPMAHEVYTRLGRAMLEDGRPGEAISPLRRAANLGAEGKVVWPLLARAFLEREYNLAAYAAILEAEEAGAAPVELEPLQAEVNTRLEPALTAWRSLVS